MVGEREEGRVLHSQAVEATLERQEPGLSLRGVSVETLNSK